MRKWTEYLVIMLLGICAGGCAGKETGSELLTGTKEAVEPVTEAVEPAVEETAEGIALHIYSGMKQRSILCSRQSMWKR